MKNSFTTNAERAKNKKSRQQAINSLATGNRSAAPLNRERIIFPSPNPSAKAVFSIGQTTAMVAASNPTTTSDRTSSIRTCSLYCSKKNHIILNLDLFVCFSIFPQMSSQLPSHLPCLHAKTSLDYTWPHLARQILWQHTQESLRFRARQHSTKFLAYPARQYV